MNPSHINPYNAQEIVHRQQNRQYPSNNRALHRQQVTGGDARSPVGRHTTAFLPGARNVLITGGTFVLSETSGQAEHFGYGNNSTTSPSYLSEITGHDLSDDSTRHYLKLYQHQLSSVGSGIALWTPEPGPMSMPRSYRREGVTPGDVGILTPTGGFKCFFNLFRQPGDPRNPTTLPERFVPFTLHEFNSEDGFDTNLDGASIIAHSCERVFEQPYEFRNTGSKGAVLVLPKGSRSFEFVDLDDLRNYIKNHLMSWYNYAFRMTDAQFQNGDLHVVYACEKTSSWGMIAGKKKRADEVQTFKCNTDRLGNPITWSSSHWSEWRVANHNEINILRQESNSPVLNQCIFLRSLNMKMNEPTFNKMKREFFPNFAESQPRNPQTGYQGNNPSSSTRNAGPTAGYSEGASQPSWEGMSTHQGLPRSVSEWHPGNALNTALLRMAPNSKAAITSDRDWMLVLTKDDFGLPNSEEIVRRVFASNNVKDKDGFVYLEPKQPRRGTTKSKRRATEEETITLLDPEDQAFQDPYHQSTSRYAPPSGYPQVNAFGLKRGHAAPSNFAQDGKNHSISREEHQSLWNDVNNLNLGSGSKRSTGISDRDRMLSVNHR